MPTAPGLSAIPTATQADPGLIDNITASDIQGGIDAANLMNDVLRIAINATGVNDDGMLSPADLVTISNYIRDNPELYASFVEGHGNDEGSEETGFHLVQGDGGTLLFQGKAFVNTIADAIYHIAFEIDEGRFLNEDGDANELVADVAGWLNYFVNGVNVIHGDRSNETLYSGTYSDMFSDAKNEVFLGWGGNDQIWSGLGDDLIRAGDGDDQAGGGEGSDTLYGGNGDDKLWGNEGDDFHYGQSGNDTIGGGNGNDVLNGSTGNDKLYGENGDDTLNGGAGEDVLGGSDGNDFLMGGSGHDKLWGENGNDKLAGGFGDDRIGGGAGNDSIGGHDGEDTLSGEDGNDFLNGGAGDDRIWAGAGNDYILGGSGHDRIGADNGNDTVNGGFGGDTVTGGDGDDVIFGAAGDDLLCGNGDDDSLDGGLGQDTLRGGDGNDVYIGGAGADELADWGNGDADTFIFMAGDTGMNDAMDVIKGFTVGTDTIDLSGIAGLSFTASGFTGNGPEVMIDDRVVLIDSDGNGVADGAISVEWATGLSVDDLIL